MSGRCGGGGRREFHDCLRPDGRQTGHSRGPRRGRAAQLRPQCRRRSTACSPTISPISCLPPSPARDGTCGARACRRARSSRRQRDDDSLLGLPKKPRSPNSLAPAAGRGEAYALATLHRPANVDDAASLHRSSRPRRRQPLASRALPGTPANARAGSRACGRVGRRG